MTDKRSGLAKRFHGARQSRILGGDPFAGWKEKRDKLFVLSLGNGLSTRTACLSSPSTLQGQDPGLPCPMEPLCKTTCHCRGPCGYMTSNNKDGVQIVLFFFMNVACLLCSLSLFIDYSDQKEQITMTTARSGLPHNIFHSLVYILTIMCMN